MDPTPATPAPTEHHHDPPAPVDTGHTNIAPTDMHTIAPGILGEDSKLHIPQGVPSLGYDGATVSTPTVVDGKFVINIVKQGGDSSEPLTATIAITAQNGNAVVDVGTNSMFVPDGEVTKYFQTQLDAMTGGRPVENVVIDNTGLHITYKK